VDDLTKKKLRNTARILHWSSLLVIGLVFAGGIVARFFEPLFVKVYFEKPLMKASSAVVDAIGDFYFNRRNELTAFLPPAHPDAMVSWANEIEERLGQPVAVFVREGSALTWINVPPEFQKAVDQVPRLFRKDVSREDRGVVDSLGSFVRRRTYVKVDTNNFTVWIVGPTADSLRWGVILLFTETWKPFFSELNKGATTPLLNPSAQRLNELLQIENISREMTTRTGLRAFAHSELLYETPGVDTTHHSYAITLSDSLKLEYYLSDEDEGAMNYFSSQITDWRNLLFLLFLGIVVHVNWRWIKKLTAG
jgi:hypothetical protein